MLQNLFHIFSISIFCFVWGLPLYFLAINKNYTTTIKTDSVIKILFAGLCVLSVVASWLSLVTAISFWVLPLITILLVPIEIFWIRLKKLRLPTFNFARPNLVDLFFFLICLILFLFLSAGTSALQDQYLYHLQSIKWISEFGTVPGIANLYLRYGFYSNWFHAISLFQFPFHAQNFTFLNCTISVWLLIYLLNNLKTFAFSTDHWEKCLGTYSFFVLLYMLLEWGLFRGSSNSTSYDFIITALTIICLDMIARYLLQKKTPLPEENFVIVFIATLPFFKLTGAITLLLFFVYLFYRGFSIKIVTRFAIVFVFALIPFLYKNYINTGYPLFPYTFLQWGHPDWQVPVQMVKQFNQLIFVGNHYLNQPIPDKAWFDSHHFSYLENWYPFLTIRDRILTAMSVSVPILAFVALKKKSKVYFGKLVALYISCYSGGMLWLLMSPDTRFVFGLLLFIVFFSLAILLASLMKTWMFRTVLIILIPLLTIYMYKKVRSGFPIRLVFPHQYQPPSQIIVKGGNYYYVPLFIKEFPFSNCYNLPLPCLYEKSGLLQYRGAKMGSGFRYIKAPGEQFIRSYRY